MRTIYFDMDGTFVNLYGVENWLEHLKNKSALPYEVAKPLLRLSTFARMLNNLKRKGYKVGVISWLAKNSNSEYDREVAEAKRKWLNEHLKSVKFDSIHIVPYGTPKEMFGTENDILFDDEEKNRNNWCGKAYDVGNIIEVLKGM